MAFPFFQELLISTLVLLVIAFCLKSWKSRNQSRPMDWPLLGVLSSFIIGGLHNFNDQITAVLAAYECNFKAQGPLASGLRFFATSDPVNVRHIFTTNHENYPKGEEFAEIFDIHKGTLFTIDGGLCRQHRAMFMSSATNPRVLALMERSRRDKVVNDLLPFMTRMASTRTPFDLQDLISRLIFHLTTIQIFCVDPGYLSTNIPFVHATTAMDTVMELGLFRHILPASCWKLMRRLNIGLERKLAVAHKQLHDFVGEMLEKRKSSSTDLVQQQDDVAAVDIIRSFDPIYSEDCFLLSRTLINYMVAGRDTVGTALPWVFYNLAKNPRVVSAIRNELEPIAFLKTTTPTISNGTNTMLFFEHEETKDLVYLKAALYESLRLHPPGPFESKKVLADDLLPSGHRLHSGETILISIYAMGRMESVWGQDCHEYVPERWLSEDGTKLRHVPAHKFMAFNSGPRMCLGKDIAMAQMKTIVAAVIWNFEVQIVEGQHIEPKLSCTLQMKDGLKVTVKKRGMQRVIISVCTATFNKII